MKMLFEEGKCDTWMTFIVGMETCLMMLDCAITIYYSSLKMLLFLLPQN